MTATPTAPPQIPCPQQVTYIVDGEESDLDSGWSGVYFDQIVGDRGSLTFAVDCPGEFLGGCGECAVSGPIASATVVDNRRCVDANEVTCAADGDCPSGVCAFFFGSPLHVSGGGFPICVTNQVSGTVTGLLSPEMGSGESDFDLLVTISTGLDVAQPCPICTGDALDAAGTCAGGARDGESCTVHGLNELFGNTSFDCPPNPGARIGETLAPLDLSTGTRSLEAAAACTSGAFAGLPCYCPDQAAPNACIDAVCTVDADEEGVCQAGPVDQKCAVEFFRSCTNDAECPAAGDTCTTAPRKCSGPTDATGATTGPLMRTGVPSTEKPVQVSTFCLDATSSAAVNEAAGLPGPAALRLPTEICIFPSCP